MGVVIRPAEEGDIESILAINHAAAQVDGATWTLNRADLLVRLAENPDDLLAAEWRGRGVVGWGQGIWRGESGEYIYGLSGEVHPDFRRRGVGRAILQRQWQAFEERQALSPHDTLAFRARISARSPGARALLESFAMQPIRFFFLMQRLLHEPLPEVPPVAPGLSLLAWEACLAERQVWEAANEAFADHWGHVPEPFTVFHSRVETGRIDPHASILAWDGDQVAGGALNMMGPGAVDRLGRNEGIVGMLFVRKPWRGRGLGKALLVRSFQRALALGHDTVGLNVDAENLTGAVRLYASVGFYERQRLVVYDRPEHS